MNSLKTKFDLKELKNEEEIELYSAFYDYDELINCILSVSAIIAGNL